jgi:2-hydroxychromene-2-carboxylate isomerase
MSQTLEFFFDCASPYTYLAATQLESLAARTGATVLWRPFLIGKAFEATGNKMPASVPAKAKYMFKDLLRWSQHYGVPFAFPKIFPINSLLPQRLACAVPAQRLPEVALAVMSAYWAQGQDVQQPAVLQALLDGLGLDGAAALEATQTDAVKGQLKANTEDAIARGAFGAPTFFIGKAMFWGNDRFTLIEETLAGRLAVA